jgi:hypothetical protein
LEHALQAVVFDSGQSSGFNEQTANTSPSIGLLTVHRQPFTVQLQELARPLTRLKYVLFMALRRLKAGRALLPESHLKMCLAGVTVATVTSKATSGESGETSE